MVGSRGGPKDPLSQKSTEKSSLWTVLVFVSAFMFLEQFKPSEPHLVPYLIEDKHFTNEQVINVIYPISIYATLISNLLAAVCVDHVGYKAIVLFGACARICTRLLLIYGTSLLSMQLAEVAYGIGEASMTVLTASIFFLVQSGQYQFVTSVTQAASLVAYVMSAELGQLLLQYGSSRLSLFYIALVAITMASIVAGFLPAGSSECESSAAVDDKTPTFCGLEGLWDVLQTTYLDSHLRALSGWWILGLSVYTLVESYGINLFQAVDPAVDFNGHIVALTRLASCVSSLLAIRIDHWTSGIHTSASGGMAAYVIGSSAVGCACLVMSYSTFLIPAYAAYIIAVSTSQLLLCLVFVQTARLVDNGRYVLLFSLNSGVSLVVQSIAQALLVQLNLSIYQQFMAFGWFSVTLAVCFGLFLMLFSFERVDSEDSSGRHANVDQSNPRSAYSSLLQSKKKSASGKARSLHIDVEADAVDESSPLTPDGPNKNKSSSSLEALC